MLGGSAFVSLQKGNKKGKRSNSGHTYAAVHPSVGMSIRPTTYNTVSALGPANKHIEIMQALGGGGIVDMGPRPEIAAI